MNLTVELVDISQKEVLKNLIKDYLIEIHQGGDGQFPWLDSYWQNPQSFPVFYQDRRSHRWSGYGQ